MQMDDRMKDLSTAMDKGTGSLGLNDSMLVDDREHLFTRFPGCSTQHRCDPGWIYNLKHRLSVKYLEFFRRIKQPVHDFRSDAAKDGKCREEDDGKDDDDEEELDPAG